MFDGKTTVNALTDFLLINSYQQKQPFVYSVRITWYNNDLAELIFN